MNLLRGKGPGGFQRLDRRRKLLILAALVVFIILIVWCIHYLRWRLGHVAENDAQIKGEVITLASRVDGWLVARPVMDGDKIVKGQILARIDDRDARLRLAAVEGTLAAARAQVSYIEAERETADKTTQAQMAQAQAQLGAAQSALASTGHQLTLAQTNF